MAETRVLGENHVYFLLAVGLSVPLRYTDSDYPFGIFKLFIQINFQLGLYFKAPHHKSGVNLGAPEGYAGSAPLVPPVVLI
jgi:hypothetical protein